MCSPLQPNSRGKVLLLSVSIVPSSPITTAKPSRSRIFDMMRMMRISYCVVQQSLLVLEAQRISTQTSLKSQLRDHEKNEVKHLVGVRNFASLSTVLSCRCIYRYCDCIAILAAFMLTCIVQHLEDFQLWCPLPMIALSSRSSSIPPSSKLDPQESSPDCRELSRLRHQRLNAG